eukprot:RCo015246
MGGEDTLEFLLTEFWAAATRQRGFVDRFSDPEEEEEEGMGRMGGHILAQIQAEWNSTDNDRRMTEEDCAISRMGGGGEDMMMGPSGGSPGDWIWSAGEKAGERVDATRLQLVGFFSGERTLVFRKIWLDPGGNRGNEGMEKTEQKPAEKRSLGLRSNASPCILPTSLQPPQPYPFPTHTYTPTHTILEQEFSLSHHSYSPSLPSDSPLPTPTVLAHHTDDELNSPPPAPTSLP